MSQHRTKVTRVEFDSMDDTWQVTVTREDYPTLTLYPTVSDVPSDVRAALREWLEGGDQ